MFCTHPMHVCTYMNSSLLDPLLIPCSTFCIVHMRYMYGSPCSAACTLKVRLGVAQLSACSNPCPCNNAATSLVEGRVGGGGAGLILVARPTCMDYAPHACMYMLA